MSGRPPGDRPGAPAEGAAALVRRTARRLGVENKVWRVYLDTIEGDSGAIVPDYVVLEPRLVQAGGIAGVAVIPVLAGEIVLLRTWRHALPGYFWEAVKGFVDAGEAAGDAALRELAEETGCRCAPERLVALGTIAQEPSTLGARVALFAALDCRRERDVERDEPGLGVVHTFSPREAFRMAAASEIEDAVTLIALMRLQALGSLM